MSLQNFSGVSGLYIQQVDSYSNSSYPNQIMNDTNIEIVGNEELKNFVATEGWNGSGTIYDPYQIDVGMENGSISISNTNLAISIANQIFNETRILIFNSENIEISTSNFQDSYIEIIFSKQISVLKNIMTQTKNLNGWQPLIVIENSIGIDVLENFYHGTNTRSFFLSLESCIGIVIQDNSVQITSEGIDYFLDIRNSVQIIMKNNTFQSQVISKTSKISASNFIVIENNNFQFASFDIWAVNDFSLRNNIFNESSIYILSSIFIDFILNQVIANSLEILRSSKVNITLNTFSNSFDAIILGYVDSYTIENNIFIDIGSSKIRIYPTKQEASNLSTYLITSSIITNIILGSILIRKKIKLN